MPNPRFSIAPMMDWTDRHCRIFHRLLSKRALLYTEMVTANAVIHGDQERLLGFSEVEHPLALQLGGNDPVALAKASKIGEHFGYDEINLNVGCPSDRVQGGCFGASMMADPALVRDCLKAMQDAVSVPVTIKCRIGIDDMDEDEAFGGFVDRVLESGVLTFIVHARKAWLSGLSPKENRDVPPLNYERVYKLKQAHPTLRVVINGGVTTAEECLAHLNKVDGVMMGRSAYQTPYVLAQVDQALFGDKAPLKTRHEIARAMVPYIDAHLSGGGRLHQITRHMLGLFHGEAGARSYRRILSEEASKEGAGVEVLEKAILRCT